MTRNVPGSRRASLVVALATGVLVVAGCGGGSGTATQAAPSVASAAPPVTTVAPGSVTPASAAPPAATGLTTGACALISADEAAAFLASPIRQGPVFTETSGGSNCQFLSEGGQTLSLLMQTTPPMKPGEVETQFTNGSVVGEAISGLGDRAYSDTRSPSDIRVVTLKGGTLIDLHLTGPDSQDKAADVTRLVTLMASLLARL